MACSSRFLGSPLYDLSLFLYDLFCLLRRGDPPHTAEGIHIKRHIVHLALIIGHRAVGIAVELSQAVDKIPNLPAAGMEDMGAVFMDMDALGLFTVNVSAQMIPFFQHQTFFFPVFLQNTRTLRQTGRSPPADSRTASFYFSSVFPYKSMIRSFKSLPQSLLPSETLRQK